MYQSVDFFQFQKRFSTERRCWRYLFKQRWPDGFVCPKCGHRRATFLAERKVFQCRNCRYQASVTAGTIFHKTRTPLRKWFWMIFLISQNKTGYSVLGLQKFLQINLYKTAWLMAHKIRQAMAQRDAPYKLAGLVEMDDSYFGAKGVAGKRGRGAQKKSKVIVSVQLNDNKRPLFANMQVVDQLDKRSISQSLYNKIGCGTRVDTDGWASYNILKEQGLDHRRHIVGSPKNASKLLPWVHIIISNCKGILLGTHHGVSSVYLQRYLSEFCYRFNRRFWPDQLFDRLITACLSTSTITLAELRV